MLPAAVGRYVRYHSARLLGLQKKPSDPITKASPRAISAGSAGLEEEYLERVSWPLFRQSSVPRELSSDPIYQLWTKTAGGQKWSQYFAIYREVFGHLVQSPIRMLEIGVYRGASLELWRRYFTHPDSLIVGIDIDGACARFDSPSERKHVRIGSQTDAAFLSSVVQEFGPFDLIVDDGSHKTGDVTASFNHLFLTGLKEPGIYVVEDLHAGYWQGWRTTQQSFLDVCKEMVEFMHAHYEEAGPGELFVDRPSDHKIAAVEVPRLTTLIKEIRFFDSVVAIYKSRREYMPFNVCMDSQAGAEWAAGRRS
jgi:hypothetical protein